MHTLTEADCMYTMTAIDALPRDAKAGKVYAQNKTGSISASCYKTTLCAIHPDYQKSRDAILLLAYAVVPKSDAYDNKVAARPHFQQ